MNAKYGDRSVCKNCGKSIIYTTDEEQTLFWAHRGQERSMFNPRRVNCELTAYPILGWTNG